jgi:hypothetical protein
VAAWAGRATRDNGNWFIMKKTSFSFGGVKPSAAKKPALSSSAFEDAPETAAPEPKQPSQESAPDEDVDPLDAFMSGIATKKSAPKPKPQVRIWHIIQLSSV